MGSEPNGDDAAPLSPDEAFAAIGHEIRVGILEALATTDRADRPVPFSALRERVGTVDSAKFNYHLDELVGHFVERTDEGYGFQPAGKRVAEAILSGAVTDDPVVELSRIDESCHYCGAPIEVTYRRERVAAYCPECDGTFGSSNVQDAEPAIPDEYGFLGNLDLPPAGVTDRTPSEIFAAAHTWSLADRLLAASDTCPRCAATFDEWIDVCGDHDREDGGCERCGNRYAVLHSASCTNCTFDQRVPFGLALLDDARLQAFLTGHGINLVSPEYERYASAVMDYEETVLAGEPFEARFTFTAGGEAISLTVDDEFEVVDVVEHEAFRDGEESAEP
ncbi:winged helix-turn-helix domain-containing protein [Halorussus sp. AFM4]|uniref:winged helix-turn-helix domain-containing protein n=1 Tax=Halorussus sp. AFM4 TaxID=3421651 RepID=UPI003EBE625A